ncbi:SDR family oxidoreductase [Hydrogenivirga sp. 128-5-R1-1]|uniref:SDR family oxidoreductase n=1 Tax=Hydrogenivirga sp. 128-5-R1-1 TaxID=392423 RepID=UPI00015F39FF|nr:SDR family oxidoreductase [Hydrogenivirga sp. 128-5-R1-1]EDP74115.1 Short-chain dehydrogenase/reductase SDR [Hydrogenivirga sp. 128-5-R1-1]
MECKPLKGKLAFITGGSRGIGRAIALKLADMGADVIVNYYKNKEKAEEVVKEIQAKGQKGYTLQADFGKKEDIDKAFDWIKEEFGYLDIFVSNAVASGREVVGGFAPFLRLKERGTKRIYDITVFGFIWSVQKAVPLMEGRKGKIIAISSTGTKDYMPNYAIHGSAKSALEALVRYAAVELGEKGINVNTVSGGPIDTEAIQLFPNYEEVKEGTIKLTPLGRMGMPEDIAGVVGFLCTEDAQWIQGQTIVVDGGLSLVRGR